ncbi:hypothetical protein ACWDA7_34800 [Streptomyces sp. NPDC001156]|jgi:hypothetical protein
MSGPTLVDLLLIADALGVRVFALVDDEAPPGRHEGSGQEGL